jgi:hypothetical protein
LLVAVSAGGMVERADAASVGSLQPQRAELGARAAFVPLAAIMVCSRVCPAAGLAAAKILQRAPREIRLVRAPNPAVASAVSSAAGSSSGRVLGNALVRTADDAARLRAAGFNAHHIVAVNHPRAEFSRMVLGLRGIGPNSPANGVWLLRTAHAPIHSNAYYANVNAVMAKYYFNPTLSNARLVDDLARIGRLLQKGQLPL